MADLPVPVAPVPPRSGSIANRIQTNRGIGAGAEPVIVVDRVRKKFRLYHERNNSLKAALMRRRVAKFEEFWAIDDVSFDIRPGETFGIIGENGSGKSTMLKCIARILRPDHGKITTKGKISALLELGAGFHPELSGRENVYLNGSILGLSKKDLDLKFDEIVDFAGLHKFIDQPVKNYSSGMYVRLGFSIAINVDPDILLVDEVLAVGDESFQRRCAEKFAELQNNGKTIVLVSHAMGQVRALCDRLAWMNHGRLEMVGPAKEVIDNYLGDVHVERFRRGPGAEVRWGTGEIKLDAIELLVGDDDTPVLTVRQGDKVTIRLRYTVPGMAVERPVFGFAIYRSDGVHVTGVNYREHGMTPDLLSGSGSFDFVIDSWPVFTGTFDLSAAAQNLNYTYTYDWWQNAVRFETAPGKLVEAEGVLILPGSWKHRQRAGNALL